MPDTAEVLSPPVQVKKYCDCAQCGITALGASCLHLWKIGDRYVAGRITGRPYCNWCLRLLKAQYGKRLHITDEVSPLDEEDDDGDDDSD